MQTPEAKVKQRVKEILDEAGAYYDMPVPSGYGKPTLDFIGCYKGYYFAIETKAPGNMPTIRQEQTMTQMQKAGAKVFLIDGESYDYSQLQIWFAKVDFIV